MRATSGLLLHGDLTAGKPSEVKPRFKMSQNVGQNPGSGILIVAGFEPGNKRTNPAGTDAPGQLILREPCASAQTPQPLPEFFGRSESVMSYTSCKFRTVLTGKKEGVSSIVRVNNRRRWPAERILTP
jgi:hypothetical protein